MSILDTGEQLYYPAPPVILSYREYQNVNADKRLQNMVTEKFLKKLRVWLKEDPTFKSVKKFNKIIDKDEGYDVIHYILRILVKKGRTNWYDLDLQEGLVKKYILFKLKEYV
jgi:hypothetical protein